MTLLSSPLHSCCPPGLFNLLQGQTFVVSLCRRIASLRNLYRWDLLSFALSLVNRTFSLRELRVASKLLVERLELELGQPLEVLALVEAWVHQELGLELGRGQVLKQAVGLSLEL